MAKYYQGPYWVRGDDDERWASDNQRIGWTDDDTRRVARAGDHAWYWSEQQRRHVAVDDGLTTTDDVATQLAAGIGGQELAARFWVDAAHLLSDTAWTDLQAVYTDVGGGQRRREDLTPAERAMVEAAENRADAWGEASNRAATIAQYGSEEAAEAADAAQGRDHAEAQRIHQVLFDGDYYAAIVGDGQADDSYSDHLWATAQTHVAMSHTATGLRAQRSADEAATPAGPGNEPAQREREDPTNAAWRTAVAVTYREHVLDYGNDGRPEDDRHLSPSEVAARAMAITTIAGATGAPEGYVFAELRAAADAYGSAPGSDNDPDYLAPPNWDTFTTQYETRTTVDRADWVAYGSAEYVNAGMPAGKWVFDQDDHLVDRDTGQALVDEPGSAATDPAELDAEARAALESDLTDSWRTAVDVEYDQRCADYGNDGRPEDDRHISTEDKAAQAAAVAAIAQRTGLPTGAVWDAVRDVTDRYARDHTDTATLDQPDWDQVADDWAALMDQNRADASGSELPVWEREADQTAYWDELGQSYPAVPAAPRETPMDRLLADRVTAWQQYCSDPTAANEAALTAAGDAYDTAQDTAQAQRTAGDGAQAFSAAGDPYDHAFHHGRGADLLPVPAQYTEHPDAHRSGPTSPAADARATDPVLGGSVAADLLDELDQARAQLESGDVHSEDSHDLAQRIEHLSHRAAEAIVDEAGPQSEQGRAAELADLAAWRGDHDDCWRDDDATTEQGLALGSVLRSDVFTQILNGGTDPADPGQQDPELAAKTVGVMAAQAAVTQRWLADHAAGLTPVDSHDWMVDNHTPANRDAGGGAPSGAEQEEITHDREARDYARYLSSDPDTAPGEPGICTAGPDPARTTHGTDSAPGHRSQDPIERARQAVGNLNAARGEQTHTQQLSAQHVKEATRGLSTSDGRDPQEPGW